jgi:phage baseplate assembly protein V
MNVQLGTISQTFNDKALAKVKVDGRVTNPLKIISQATKFKRHYSPLSVNDQVLVVNPFGANNDGFILIGLFFDNLPVPEGLDDDTEITIYSDGTTIKHNSKTNKITIDTKLDIEVTCNNLTATSKKATIKADKVDVDCKDVDLGLGGTGVQTDESNCNLTGNPCMNGSKTIKATK